VNFRCLILFYPGGITYQREIIEPQAPLLKLCNEEGKEQVLNTSPLLFHESGGTVS
jgi:hypothetical protein